MHYNSFNDFMNNHKVFNDYCNRNYFCQTGCFFSVVHKAYNYILAKSDFIKTLLWNHVFVDHKLNEKEFSSLEKEFLNSASIPFAVYVYEDDLDNIKFLLNHSLKREDIEAWMIAKPLNSFSGGLSYAEVNNDNNDLFYKGLSAQFEKEYGDAFLFERNHTMCGKSVKHMLFFKEQEFIGTGSIYFLPDISFIHNVGVFEQHRKKGYASEITRTLLALADRYNPDHPVMLQCNGGPEGHERVYEKSGFKLVFRRYGFQKNG